MKTLLTSFLFSLFVSTLFAQKDSLNTPHNPSPSPWYQQINFRGYMQLRHNGILETNDKLYCDQCDKSWGQGSSGFFIRRLRFIFFGQPHKNVYFYIQPDFASNPSSDKLFFGQLRDAFIDLGFDANNEFRLRLGQSKIPYGFENMQSSQNRLPFDRSDAINSAAPNERDLGAFLYWAPLNKRKLFAKLVADGLKGSGDYGVFAIGIYNGQGANNPQESKKQHLVSRFSLPFQIKNQFLELGIQAYTGQFIIPKTNLSPGVKVLASRSYSDSRLALSATLFPQPFGIQAEYNWGAGPAFNKQTDSIENTSLNGGYILISYKTAFRNHTFLPFFRYQYYNGAKKFEKDARSYLVSEYETGIEWQLNKHFELSLVYLFSSRRFEDFSLKNNAQSGSLFRIQAQLSF